MDVFLDMDGVLVDLAKGFENVTGYRLCWQLEKEMGKEHYWTPVNNARPEFWSSLPKMPDADHLVGRLLDMFSVDQMHILSAVFNDHEECEEEKRVWIDTNHPEILPYQVNIVQRSEKKLFARNQTTGLPNLLIDDMEKNCVEWTKAGGIAVLHTSAESSLITVGQYR